MQGKTLNTNAQAVLDVLRANSNHPTAQELYEQVRRVRPNIGVATVYRILHQLREQGMIREIGRDVECRYDADTGHHDHAICTLCGALLDVPADVRIPQDQLLRAAQSAGVELNDYEVRIYGRCRQCRQQNN